MRGTILGFDPAIGEGVIATDDGQRVRFLRESWRSPGEPLPGRLVDYALVDGAAADIYVVPGTAGAWVATGEPPERRATIYGAVSLTCALFTYMLGPFGIFTVFPALVFGVMGRNASRGLADRTGYYLSIAGLVLSLIALLLVAVVIAGVLGLVGLFSWIEMLSWQH